MDGNSKEVSLRNALKKYNNSDAYVKKVLSLAKLQSVKETKSSML